MGNRQFYTGPPARHEAPITRDDLVSTVGVDGAINCHITIASLGHIGRCATSSACGIQGGDWVVRNIVSQIGETCPRTGLTRRATERGLGSRIRAKNEKRAEAKKTDEDVCQQSTGQCCIHERLPLGLRQADRSSLRTIISVRRWFAVRISHLPCRSGRRCSRRPSNIRWDLALYRP